jgi:hypothetical protein
MNMTIYLDGGIGWICRRRQRVARNLLLAEQQVPEVPPAQGSHFVPLSPERRYAVNQDAEVAILAFAGALTCSGAKFNGRVLATTV